MGSKLYEFGHPKAVPRSWAVIGFLIPFSEPALVLLSFRILHLNFILAVLQIKTYLDIFGKLLSFCNQDLIFVSKIKFIIFIYVPSASIFKFFVIQFLICSLLKNLKTVVTEPFMNSEHILIRNFKLENRVLISSIIDVSYHFMFTWR